MYFLAIYYYIEDTIDTDVSRTFMCGTVMETNYEIC